MQDSFRPNWTSQNKDRICVNMYLRYSPYEGKDMMVIMGKRFPPPFKDRMHEFGGLGGISVRASALPGSFFCFIAQGVQNLDLV